jgi:hypothetical protein
MQSYGVGSQCCSPGAWTAAAPFPGVPVFGGAGAIVGDDLVLIDGVATSGGFALVNQAWRARLDPSDPTAIAWTDLGEHPPPARYRAAAGAAAPQILFHGGTDDAYNYDGLSYASGQAAPPLSDTLAFDQSTGEFTAPLPDKPTATMDHRALVECGGGAYTIGGMVAGPAVTDAVWRLGP